HTLRRLDADGEVGAVARGVGLDHRRQAELAAALAAQRQADQPARVGDHEVDVRGTHAFGGHDQVALVLAVLVVDDHDHAAVADFLQQLGNRREAHACVSASRADSSRSTCRASRSTSMFTTSPRAACENAVCASVCGTSATSKPCGDTALTVRLTPSTQIEPFSAMYFSSCSGAKNVQRWAPVSSSMPVTAPTPSTWPLTRCPPSRSPSRSARSRLSARPTGSVPSVVSDSVSAETSASKCVASNATTVRHAPL